MRASNERRVVVEKAATRGRVLDRPRRGPGAIGGDLRMLLAGDGFGGGAGRVRRAGSAPIAFALASTLSRNARILRTWSSSPGKVMPLAGRRPDGDTAVVVVVDSCVVVAAASFARTPTRGAI